LLSTTAAHVSQSLDSFCSWLLLGVGATYTFVLSNLASLQDLIAVASVRASLYLLLAAIAVGVVQRWLAATVAASCATSEKADEIGCNLSAQEVEVDFAVVFREMQRGLFYPAKWMARRSFKKAMKGDFAVGGRLAAALSQAQAWLTFLLVALVIAALAVTASGIQV
jgi:hypothetical protein